MMGEVIKEIFDSIEYQWAFFILPRKERDEGEEQNGDDDELVEVVAGRILRPSAGKLFVRLEDPSSLTPKMAVEMHVPAKKGVIEAVGQIDEFRPTSDGAIVASVVIFDLTVTQRRRNERYPCRFLVRYGAVKTEDDGGDVFQSRDNAGSGRASLMTIGRAVDISLGGLRFEGPKPFPRDTRLALEIELHDGVIDVEATVIHVTMQPPKTYVLGVEFYNPDDLIAARIQRLMLQLQRREKGRGAGAAEGRAGRGSAPGASRSRFGGRRGRRSR